MKSSLNQLLESPCFKKEVPWRQRCFKANEVIIKAGETSGCVYVLRKGSVRVVANIVTGSSRALRPGFRDLESGDVFGEFSLLDEAPHSTNVIAIMDCEIMVIESKHLLAFLEKNHDYGYLIFRELALTLVERLRKTNDKAFSLYAWGLKAHGYEAHLK